MSTATTNPRVKISWNGSGAFTGAYDDVTNRVPSDPGLAIDVGKDGARLMDPPKVSALDFDLFNHDGRYSQERPDSPVYQLVLPGRPVAMTAQLGTSDTYDGPTPYTEDDFYDSVASFGLATAAIQTISQTTAYGQQRVTLNCLGVESVLVAGSVTVGLMASPRIDQCITAILDAVGWPSGAREISISDGTLLYWWCDARAPWDALTELVTSEGAGAALYVVSDVNRGAVLHFENRNFRTVAARSTTPQATFFDSGLEVGPLMPYTVDDAYSTPDLYDGATTGLWFTNMAYSPGFDEIRNHATYTVRLRSLGALGPIWTYPSTVTIPSGQPLTLIAHPNDPFMNAVVPVNGTDYTVSGGTVSVTLSATSGLVAFITFTATSGAPSVAGLQLRAQSLTEVSTTTVQNSIDASASIAKFSPIPGVPIPRTYDVNGWPEMDIPNATAVCNSWVARYQVQRPTVELTIENADDAHVRQMFDRLVSDRISVSERNTGLRADVWINSKQLLFGGAGASRLTCVLRCERCDDLHGSVWDAAAALWGSSPSDPLGAIWGL
jgi:hypothetical protein